MPAHDLSDAAAAKMRRRAWRDSCASGNAVKFDKLARLTPIMLSIHGTTCPAMAATNQPPIEVTLSLEYSPGAGPVAQIEFRNRGTTPALLAKWLSLPEGRMDGEHFIVRADDRPVAYLGRTVKRSPPRPEDCLPLAPGQAITTRVVLRQYYALPPRSQISATYEAFNPTVGSQYLMTLRSNTATLTLN